MELEIGLSPSATGQATGNVTVVETECESDLGDCTKER